MSTFDVAQFDDHDTATTTAVAARPRREQARGGRSHAPALLVAVLAAVPSAAAAAALSVTDHSAWPWVVCGVWALVLACRGASGRSTPAALLAARDARTTFVLGSLAAFASVAGLLSGPAVRDCLLTTAVVGLSLVAARRVLPATTAVRRVFLVGDQAEVETYIDRVADERIVSGCLLVDARGEQPVQPSQVIPTTTSLERIGEMLTAVEADDIVVLPSAAVDTQLVRKLSWLVEHTGVTVGIFHPVSSVSAHRLRANVSRHGTVLELSAPRAGRAARMAKGLIDRVGAAVLLTLLSPLFALIWLAVRLDSHGPGFFVQTRVGHGGVPFRMLKFRTMHVDAESLLVSLIEENEADGVLFKIRRDPRVTKVGSWLRRSSLDELPQLVNVLRGQMSLVGPRPALPVEVSGYDDVARRRLTVRPGITGLWQVSGRSDLSWDESLLLDLYYTDNWRLRDDFAIAARTVSAVVRARGAY